MCVKTISNTEVKVFSLLLISIYFTFSSPLKIYDETLLNTVIFTFMPLVGGIPLCDRIELIYYIISAHLFRVELLLWQTWYDDMLKKESSKYQILSGNIEEAVSIGETC